MEKFVLLALIILWVLMWHLHVYQQKKFARKFEDKVWDSFYKKVGNSGSSHHIIHRC